MSYPESAAGSTPVPDLPPANIMLVAHDLPAGLTFPFGMVAIDTETTGLSVITDRLCLCQVSDGLGNVWLVKFTPPPSGAALTDADREVYSAPNLRALLLDNRITKLYHYGRFDIAQLAQHLGLAPQAMGPVFCTKIASKLARPEDTRHNLRTLCRHYLGVELDKSEQMSNWAAPELTQSQMAYAASDVLYLHRLRAALLAETTARGYLPILNAAFDFLPTRVAMDLAGLSEGDLFAHH